MPCLDNAQLGDIRESFEALDMRGSPTGFRFSDDRTVAESRIVEMLLLAGWALSKVNGAKASLSLRTG
jgi:hypothetical protein